MGQWRGKYLDTGPPRGPGHYSKDGRWWWEDGRGDLSATRPSLADVAAQGAWLETQRERFQELHQQLLVEGWRPAAVMASRPSSVASAVTTYQAWREGPAQGTGLRRAVAINTCSGLPPRPHAKRPLGCVHGRVSTAPGRAAGRELFGV